MYIYIYIYESEVAHARHWVLVPECCRPRQSVKATACLKYRKGITNATTQSLGIEQDPQRIPQKYSAKLVRMTASTMFPTPVHFSSPATTSASPTITPTVAPTVASTILATITGRRTPVAPGRRTPVARWRSSIPVTVVPVTVSRRRSVRISPAYHIDASNLISLEAYLRVYINIRISYWAEECTGS